MSTAVPAPLDDDAAATVADALLPMLGLEADPAWRPAIVANLKATAAAARLVLEFPLEDDIEPAPVFRA